MIVIVLAITSLTLGSIVSACNWYSIFASYKYNRNVSPIPLIGASFLTMGLLGFQQTRPYAWVGIIADWGTIALIAVIPALTWEAWCTSRPNLLHRFVSDSDGRTDDIRLFKRGVFTIKTEYSPAKPCNEHGALIVEGGFTGSWTLDGDVYHLEGYAENRVLKIKRHDAGYVTEEDNYPAADIHQYDRMGCLILRRVT